MTYDGAAERNSQSRESMSPVDQSLLLHETNLKGKERKKEEKPRRVTGERTNHTIDHSSLSTSLELRDRNFSFFFFSKELSRSGAEKC